METKARILTEDEIKWQWKTGITDYIFTVYNVCSVHQRDTMSTSGGYHEYIGGIS